MLDLKPVNRSLERVGLVKAGKLEISATETPAAIGENLYVQVSLMPERAAEILCNHAFRNNYRKKRKRSGKTLIFLWCAL